MNKNKSDYEGYILRITKDEWMKQVFERMKYYAGVRRKWTPGLTIFFARKTEKGDSLIGYGVVETVQKLEELTEEERRECEKWGWNVALVFKYLIKLDQPLLIKDSILKDSKMRGKYLHGFALDSAKVQSLLNQAEQLS
ncbi:MAG: hypothetical protein U9O89_05020 [Thermoproteota archaeon]|nr:hypothetical protein [Thermoproteota archaeon]